MADSYVVYTASGSSDTFSIPFGYLDPTHMHVSVDAVEVPFTFPSASQVQLNTMPTVGQSVRVFRVTPRDQRQVVWQNAANLTADDLNTSDLQLLYIVQEAFDISASALNQDPIGNYDAQNKRIMNVADPVDALDAVNKQYADAIILIAQGYTNQTLGYRNEAQGFRNEASGFRDQSLTYRNEAQGFRNEASGFRNESEGFRNEAEGFRDEAEGARDLAQGYMEDAEDARDVILNDAGFIAVASDLLGDDHIGTAATNIDAIIAAPGFAQDAEDAADLAKDWATKESADVETNLRSAKSYAQENLTVGGQNKGGSAKDWAITAEDVEVSGGEYSAKHWAMKAASSASGTGGANTLFGNATGSSAPRNDISVASSRIVARGPSGNIEGKTVSDVLDFVGSTAQGDILYRSGSGWARLAAGTSNNVLKTGGAGADPSWGTLAKGDVGLGNVQNVDQTNASNLSSGTVPTARLGSGAANSGTFLRGDNTWQTINTSPPSTYGAVGTYVFASCNITASGPGQDVSGTFVIPVGITSTGTWAAPQFTALSLTGTWRSMGPAPGIGNTDVRLFLRVA